ncbi:hypothetical protein Sjap_023559 [Stephania japonica]|uniref:Uncharacterized protein n=1 Tax=Stephania japonica TaxID=461633 RepID=A0AAP0EEY4_9MAGN
MDANTTSPDYWLNWRFLICSIWVLSPVVFASILIWRYECSSHKTDREENRQDTTGSLYEYETWRPCLKGIHPAWLLAFRFISFLVLFALIAFDIIFVGASVLYFYTQWTFLLVTIYFGVRSSTSMWGCYQYFNGIGDDHFSSDSDRGTYMAPPYQENPDISATPKIRGCSNQFQVRQAAGKWGYVFQILFQVIYQICAGAVLLTDCVFWLVLFPFLSYAASKLTIMKICMHSVNAFFLLADTALNSLRFPWFRIAYFLIFTATFVIFQWIIHACISIPWPYPFLDLSSTYAPLWYLVVALLHLPCYYIFVLIIRLKSRLLLSCFPHSSDYTS